MKTFLLIIVLVCFSNSYSQWYLQYGGANTDVCGSVSFTDNDHGFVLVNGNTLLKTTNGGNDWIKLNITNDSLLGIRIKFLTENNGYMIATGGKILYTSNGGINWVIKYQNSNYGYNAFDFIDSLHGTAVGPGGLTLQTNDGGNTWIKKPSLGGNVLRAVHFSDIKHGTICGSPTVIIRTTDGGNTWFKQTPPVTWAANLWSVYFPDSLHGYVVGDIDNIFQTTDGGNTWIDKSIYNTGFNLYAVCFTDPLTGTVLGNKNGQTGEFLRTTNGGESWSDITTNLCVHFKGVCFTDPLHGTAVGYNGAIFHTTNGGTTFFNKENSLIPDQFILDQNYPNPFNPATTISYSIPSSSNIKLIVYNPLGQTIKILENSFKNAGKYSINFSAINLPSGIYFYKLEAAQFTQVKKMMLIK
jgi:photosystem II stability/assembly factor-like uncharacterized protein